MLLKKTLIFSQKNHLVIISFSILILSLIITLLFPVYFREDDTLYLEYAYNNYDNLLSAFIPQKAILADMHRPMQNITWLLLFNIFGLNPFPYQVFCTFLYGLSFILFFKFLKLVFNKQIAFLSVISYMAIFFNLGYIIFWFSDLSYIVELFFINLSFYLIIKAIQMDKQYLWGVLVYILGVLSKEPVALIVPLGVLGYLITDWKNLGGKKIKRLRLAIYMCIFGIIYLFLNPCIKYRIGINLHSDISQAIDFFIYRWFMYSDYLYSGTGIVIWITIIYITMKCLFHSQAFLRGKTFFFILLGSVIISILLRVYTEYALVVLFLCLFILTVKRHRTLIGIMWFAFSLLGIMAITTVVKTLLIEASFGIAIVVGVAMNDIIDHFKIEWKQYSEKVKRVFNVFIGIILICCIILSGLFFFNKYIKVLDIVSANRQNFKNVIQYMMESFQKDSSFVFIVNYEMMGLKKEDILYLPNQEKAHRQKTMNRDDLRRMFYLLKNENIRVINLGDFVGNEFPEGSYLLIMNNYENSFIKNLPIQKELIFESKSHGESAFIYHILSL